jgi:hypothetical protein
MWSGDLCQERSDSIAPSIEVRAPAHALWLLGEFGDVEKPGSGIDATVDLVYLLPDTINRAQILRRIAQIVAKPATKSLLA